MLTIFDIFQQIWYYSMRMEIELTFGDLINNADPLAPTGL